LSENRIFYQVLINVTSKNPRGEDVQIPAGTVLFYDPEDREFDVNAIMNMVVKGEARIITKDEVLEALKHQTATKEIMQ